MFLFGKFCTLIRKKAKKEKVGWSDFLYELKKDCSADKLFLPKKLFSADRVTR
jgi:hypothetical protein